MTEKIEDKIVALHSQNKNVNEIAMELHLKPAKVYQHHAALKLVPIKKPNELHQKMISLAKEHEDLSYIEIARLLNCSRQNVSHVCRRAGIKRRDSPKRLSTRILELNEAERQ